MSNPERRGYFGPRKDRPHQEKSRRVIGGKNRDASIQSASETIGQASSNPFPPFNPENDVVVGQFVALQVELTEVKGGVLYYLAKVLEVCQGNWAKKMKVLWYWPSMKPGTRDEKGSHRVRYTDCMESSWEPSGESMDWVEKESAIYSWVDVPRRGQNGNITRSNITVHGVQTEKTVLIPTNAKSHLGVFGKANGRLG